MKWRLESMNDNITFPMPPNNPDNQQRQMYMGQAYTTDGKQVQVETIPPNNNQSGNRLGANFSGLVGNNVMVPIGPTEINTEKKKISRKRNLEQILRKLILQRLLKIMNLL